ncbi:hypothetical protein [Dyella sp. C9]|uniref:hypothetical protein n=1 Tax=Dyella sp. C9 TaxID=2202154 RepID=UPI001E5EAE85|nr:hypothetical protein [Dyella sp. C9]
MHFPQAGFLALLDQPAEQAPAGVMARLSPSLRELLLARTEAAQWTGAASLLGELLRAREATLQAAFDTALAADELRRYQKFAKPGRPSAHIIQLRQKQAGARQASNLSRQSLIKAAAAFVRDAGIDVPERTTLDVFIVGWIDANVPGDAA